MMKKDSKKSKPRRPERTEEMKALDSSLGSFGLEPPKIYRQGQRVASSDAPKKSAPKKRGKHTPQHTAPREQVKKQNQKRRLKKEVRRALYAILIALGIVTVIVVLSLTVLFKIETITISGNKQYTKQQISAVLPIATEQNLFTADTSGAKEKLETNLPYIYHAEIKRKFPSTITVNITETPQIYYIKNADKSYTYMDDNFKVLESRTEKAPKKGVEIRKAAIKNAVNGTPVEFTDKKVEKNLFKLSDTVKKIEMEKVTALYSQDINNNFIVFDGRITIKLGSLDNAEDKLYAALSAIDKLSESNPQAEGELTATSDKQIYFTEK